MPASPSVFLFCSGPPTVFSPCHPQSEKAKLDQITSAQLSHFIPGKAEVLPVALWPHMICTWAPASLTSSPWGDFDASCALLGPLQALLWLGKGLAPGWLHDCSSHSLGFCSNVTFSVKPFLITLFTSPFSLNTSYRPGLPHFFPLALSQPRTLYVVLVYFALH